MNAADWRDVIDNNLNGAANTIRAFAPKTVERNNGGIVDLSSMQCKHGTIGAASHSASKWGILGPTITLKVERLPLDDISPDAANMVAGADYEAPSGDSAKSI